MSHRKQIAGGMRLHWKKETWMRCADDWLKVTSVYEEHKECEVVILCCRCNKEFCEHNKDLMCYVFGVCPFCDYYIQPYVCNPINLKYYIEYCPWKEEVIEHYKSKRIDCSSVVIIGPLTKRAK